MWQLRVELTRSDKTELNNLLSRAVLIPIGMMFLCGLGCIVCGLVFLFIETLQEKAPWVILGGIEWILPAVFILWYKSTQTYWPGTLLTPPRDYTLSIGEEDLEVDRLFGEEPEKFNWSSFHSLHETANLWVLEKTLPAHPRPTVQERYLVIPKRFVVPERTTEFGNYLRTHTAKRTACAS